MFNSATAELNGLRDFKLLGLMVLRVLYPLAPAILSHNLSKFSELLIVYFLQFNFQYRTSIIYPPICLNYFRFS